MHSTRPPLLLLPVIHFFLPLLLLLLLLTPHSQHVNKRDFLVFTLLFSPPLPLLPCLITSYSTEAQTDSSALSYPPSLSSSSPPTLPPLAYVPPTPTHSPVCPLVFLVAVSL